MTRILVLLLSTLLISNGILASSEKEIDQKLVVTPTITSFTKADYEAENQNWDVSSATSGAVYFANSHGLLKYDGEDWSHYKTNNILRAVYCKGDTIYVGGNGIMGYFIESENLSKFHSLSTIQSDIWQIYNFNNTIVFQSFNRFFYLDEDNRIGIERITEGNTTFSFPINDEIFYQINYGRAVAFKPHGSMRPVSNNHILSKYMVKHISEIDSSKYLLGTLNNGLFILEMNKLKPIDNQLNTLLKKYKINRIIELKDDLYAFGTMNGGLIVANLNGKIKYILNTSNGLTNNRIHSMHKQNDYNLWLGTDNGITLVNLKNPLKYLENKNNGLGINYDIIEYNEHHYISTNQGIYSAKQTFDKPYQYNLKFIEGTEGHGWNLSVIDNKLFVGHNKGTFIIENEKLSKLSDIAGGSTFLQSSKDSTIIYQSSYFGVAVYMKINNKWQLSYNIDNIDGPTRDIIEYNDGSILVTTSYKEAFHVYPSHSNKRAQIIDISKNAAFKNSMWIRAFKLGDRTLLAANDTCFYYKNEKLETAPTELQKITYVSDAIKNYCFVLRNKQLLLYNFKNKNYTEITYDLSRIENDLIFKYELIKKMSENTYVFCLSDGIAFAVLDSLIEYPATFKKPIITNINFSNDRTGEDITLDKSEITPHNFNTIKITFSALNFQSKSKYQFFLDGYHEEWRTINKRNWVKFQNLREGEYTFYLKEKGNPETVVYSFSVAPPYYRSTLAYLVYIISFMALIIGTRWALKQLTRKKQYRSLLKIRKRQSEQLLQKTTTKLNSEIKELQSEVTNKTDKLSNLLLQNTKKREVIDSIKDELQGIKKEQRYVNARHIDKLSRMIKNNFDETKDWLVFESAFSETHENFFKKLKSKHSNLSDEDLKLCAYLKVNLSSKELAPIFKITTRSVDLKKYRLKKKLNLSKEDNLKQYIKDFSS